MERPASRLEEDVRSMRQSKSPLFSVGKDDCEWQTFRSGGPGGQNQNKLETGARCIHRPSGAVGESREERSQWPNKVRAFRRMAESPKFQLWAKLEAARLMGKPSVDEIVDQAMEPRNLKVEVRSEQGNWEEKNCLA